jgi:hypothetical protein
VRFIKTLAGAWAGLLAACTSGPPPAPEPAPVAVTPARVAGPAAGQLPPGSGPARNWAEYRMRAAHRIHASSGVETFAGALPDPLQSIPVLQVQLNADGSVRNIVVLRTPKFEPQTVEMASRAIRRAAPFGPVGHLPQPWQFNETFLYNEELKFQLRTLVEAE